MRCSLAACLSAAVVCAAACCQCAAGKEPGAASTPAPASAPNDFSAAEPVPVPEPSQQAMQYYRSGNLLWVLHQVWGLAVPALILFTGLSARLRDGARKVGRKWFFVIGVYYILYSLFAYVLDLPLDYYTSYLRPHDYGLSNQALSKWLGDSLKELMIGVVFGCLFLWVPYLLIRKSPRRWWLYTSLFCAALMFFVVLVVPIWIEPLFNRFGSMKDKQLEARILALAGRAGIEGGRVFEVEKSVDTNTVNAYVTGLWNTKRIVLWDTLIAKLNPDELLFVMAHEMGHYVLHHIVIGVLLGSLGVLFSLYLVYRLAGLLIRRCERRFGFRELSDIASLPLILLLIELVSLGMTPLVLAYSRHQEHEADRFGLEMTQNNHAAATGFVKLQAENLANPRPGPLYVLWRAGHPPLGDRIDFANAYRPWQRGEPLRYGRYFHPAASDRSAAWRNDESQVPKE